jgi:hypothetical protein
MTKAMAAVGVKAAEPDIRKVREHWEVYIGGKFIFSADTYLEAQSELKEYIKEEK